MNNFIKIIILFSIAIIILFVPFLSGEELMVYTANQGFFSRIYFLNMDGSVHHYFEYENYHFCGLEVVSNEIYAAEAFAPRVLKVDPHTGDLDVIVDDWSLYYFYAVAFDGTYFYVDEWDMNRYFFNGDKDGVASFDEDVFGLAWDGAHLWMQNDANIIKCYDVSTWPTLTELPDSAFTPPSPNCRGLWYDGTYFWTAESTDGVLGRIYKFDKEGHVIDQWMEPAYSGWGVCVFNFNELPDPPSNPYPEHGALNIDPDVILNWHCSDPEGQELTFDVHFGNEFPPPLASADQADTTFDPPDELDLETKYYWHITARDIYGDTTSGPVWSFTTIAGPSYTCGDANGDTTINVSDAVWIINYVFVGGDAPQPLESGDTNCDGSCNISDAVWIINYVFVGGDGPCDTNGDGEPDC
ncbi:MAG: hypothetical protein GWN61_22425 [candidate division Zixibacteria bacterium]|nr:hypothetical protein [candidate division Zixibacteria bacterium]NIR67238.1 hypothetical protein [candidate division Zixibacteria bacterium]NIS16082.1 hypothetical protein [candidate division Zixibacteria bacterium]NIS48620.1 hypothetical protein [candidate division Zixibacteria bacterium]NIU16687.1 hypothetical protein [candidate division Zixibacteria bacterium]